MGSQDNFSKESKRYMKMTIFFSKSDALTDEEFHRYWSEEHARLFNSLPFVQENIVKYNQYHGNVEARNKAASLGFPVAEYDAAAEIWAADLETLLGVFQDPGYLEKVFPDEEKFATRNGKFMFGYDDIKLDRT